MGKGMMGFLIKPFTNTMELGNKLNSILDKMRSSTDIYSKIMSVDYSLGKVILYTIYFFIEFNSI